MNAASSDSAAWQVTYTLAGTVGGQGPFTFPAKTYAVCVTTSA
jgi:hypothetical protein